MITWPLLPQGQQETFPGKSIEPALAVVPAALNVDYYVISFKLLFSLVLHLITINIPNNNRYLSILNPKNNLEVGLRNT